MIEARWRGEQRVFDHVFPVAGEAAPRNDVSRAQAAGGRVRNRGYLIEFAHRIGVAEGDRA